MKKLLAVLAVLAFAAPAAVAATKASVKVSPATVKAGKTVRVYGSVGTGCAKGDAVTLYSKAFKGSKHEFAGIPAVFAKQDKHHNFSIHVAIEKTVKKGSYTIGGRCGGGNLGSAATLKVS